MIRTRTWCSTLSRDWWKTSILPGSAATRKNGIKLNTCKELSYPTGNRYEYMDGAVASLLSSWAAFQHKRLGNAVVQRNISNAWRGYRCQHPTHTDARCCSEDLKQEPGMQGIQTQVPQHLPGCVRRTCLRLTLSYHAISQPHICQGTCIPLTPELSWCQRQAKPFHYQNRLYNFMRRLKTGVMHG